VLALFLILTALLVRWPVSEPKQAAAKAGSPHDLIAAVNQLRAANGLPAYHIDATLMAIAQAHSEYQASIGSVTHTGLGGSRPRDRAIAAGYGGGGTIFISENIAGGTNLSPQEAVQWWQGDAPHLNTMLGSEARDVGAGAAVSGDKVYYTLDVGYASGSGSNEGSQSTGGTAVAGANSPAPTVLWIMPVKVATPASDGTVIHVVEPGQALLHIVDAYQVKLVDVLALNGLTEQSVIYPGDKILVKNADKTPTATLADTKTPSPPTATRRPTRTPVLRTATPESSFLITETSPPASLALPAQAPAGLAVAGQDPLLLVIGGLIFVGTALVLVGTVLKRGN
jgi:LysM repeat protein